MGRATVRRASKPRRPLGATSFYAARIGRRTIIWRSSDLTSVPARLTWREYGEGDRETRVEAAPAAWGDVVLRGKDRSANYHLAVVVDDGIQEVSDVVRGRDLYS